jgi:hypothetical protein
MSRRCTVRPERPDGTEAWSYSAWQYIPSEMTAGGGQFPGPGFNLLNPYSPGGPYRGSVQVRFDPTDGMAKALHGNGLDEIQVPYVSDRWVKIEVIIDEDDDWTRVYDDDELVTEYTWTGGIISDGDACDDCPGDLDGDNTVGITDFLLALRQWGTSPGGPPDFDGDDGGITDFLFPPLSLGAGPMIAGE